MTYWRIDSKPVTGQDLHRLAEPGGHALLLPILTSLFEVLGVSASLTQGGHWWPFHNQPSVARFEIAHGVETLRHAYNARCFAEANARRRSVRGEHAGNSDLFVPIVSEGEVLALIVVGPFALKRPSAKDVIERWRGISGKQARLADPEFSAYLRATLDTLVFDRSQLSAFERYLEHLAALMTGGGRADEHANRAMALRPKIEQARGAERMWLAAREIVDERSSKEQFSAASVYELRKLGLHEAADRVAIGLTAPGRGAADPVEEIVRADGIQRAAAAIARAAGGTVAGQVGERGFSFVFERGGTPAQRKRKLHDVARSARDVARRDFGATLHFGSAEPGPTELSRLYALALEAAETALERGELLVTSRDVGEAAPSLRGLRERLARVAEVEPDRLGAEFESYAQAMTAVTGSRFETSRTELELCLERLTNTFDKVGSIDAKTAEAFRERVDRGTLAARGVQELLSIYRSAIAELVETTKRPVDARQDQALARVLEYIHQHYRERIGVERAARIAGFATTYFSELFKKREGTTFEKYLFRLRLERACELLRATDLSVVRVAEASGFGSAQYLSRVFRRVYAETPLDYRRKLLPEWLREERKSRTKSSKKGALRNR